MRDVPLLLSHLVTHGWDYTCLPEPLCHYSHRHLQRTWHRVRTSDLPPYATGTYDVLRALLEVDPPAHKNHRGLRTYYTKRVSPDVP